MNYKLKSKYFFLNTACQNDKMSCYNYIYGCKIILNDKLEFKLCFNNSDLKLLHSKVNVNKIKDNNFLKKHYQIFWGNYSKISIYRTIEIRNNWYRMSNEAKANYWIEALFIVKPFLDFEISSLKIIKIEEPISERIHIN